MLVDIEPLPYKVALEILQYCVDRNIDMYQCIRIANALHMSPPPDISWTLNIPEKDLTFLLLKIS